MKLAFQIVSALVVLLMAGQPVLAGATCEMNIAASPALCPMGMSDTGPDCPMARGMSAECLTRCFKCAAASDAVLTASPAKPKVIAAKVVTSAGTVLHVIEPMRPSFLAPVVATSSSPPTYLLNRVFRI